MRTHTVLDPSMELLTAVTVDGILAGTSSELSHVHRLENVYLV